MLLEGNRLKDNFYVEKSMMKSLGSGYQKIDMCPNFCMLYYGKYTNFTKCKIFQHAQYKPNSGRGRKLVVNKKLRYFPITYRLQRLFMSSKTIEHMTWYHSYDEMDIVIVYLFYDETWKQFYKCILSFFMELRNIHLGLWTNRFNPFGSFTASYSCYLVILIVYNLPLRMCIKPKFLILFIVIHVVHIPGKNIDVCL